MRRAWIATALLAGSWLVGLSYYEPACLPAWIVLVAAGTVLMAGLSRPGLAVESEPGAGSVFTVAFPAQSSGSLKVRMV